MGALATIAMVVGFAVMVAFVIALILLAFEVFVTEPRRRREWQLQQMLRDWPDEPPRSGNVVPLKRK